MPNISTIKDHFKESQLYLNRTVAAAVIVLALSLVLLCRLAFLQIYQHDLYKTLSLNNQVRLIPIPPTRGLIYDRNGILIAENAPIFSLEITPERTENIRETIAALEKIIPITEENKLHFYKQLRYKRNSEGIPIRMKLNEEELAAFALEKHHFPGVDIQARLVRHYPLGDMFAHVLGYIGPISEKDLAQIDPGQYRGAYYIGKTGIEKYYEKELRGVVGYQHVETDAKGRTVRILSRKLPVSGTHLHVALDSHLQLKAYQALGEYKGAVVAIDPNSGDILAMVSNPSFDPNLFVQGIDCQTYKILQHSPDRPLFNRALQGQYPPGSTIKPLVALQALDLKSVTPQFSIFDPGWFQLSSNGRLFRDWIFHAKKHGHGWVDLEKAIAQSCDTYFFTVAHKLGIQHLHDIFTRFGLGQQTHIDAPGEMAGLVPSAEWKKRARKEDWYAGDTLNVGIGQGMLLSTPLQLAQVAATLANQGGRYKPRLVRSFAKTGEFDTPIPVPPTPLPEVLLRNKEHFNTVIHAMQSVAHSPGGTAFRACQGTRYLLAGKTGTAQVFNLKQNEKYEMHKVKAHLRDHSWFIAFAPIEKPSIAIAVLVENKQTKTGADVARTILDAHFEKTQYKSNTTTLPNAMPNLDVPSLKAPVKEVKTEDHDSLCDCEEE